MTVQHERAVRSCKTIEKKLDAAIKGCWAIKHETGMGNCHALHSTRGRLVKACKKLRR